MERRIILEDIYKIIDQKISKILILSFIVLLFLNLSLESYIYINGVYAHPPKAYIPISHNLAKTIVDLREIREYITNLNEPQSNDLKVDKILQYISQNSRCEYLTNKKQTKNNCQVILSNQSKSSRVGGFYLNVQTLDIRLNL